MKKNNKGYTLVEVIVSFSLVMIVMVYLLKTIIVISEKNAELLLMQEYNVFESILLDKIYEDLDSVGNLTTISNENEITFNEINKSLKIDINNKSIIYDDIIYELPDNFEFKNDSYDVINIEDGKYLIININLNVDKEDKKLKIVHSPYVQNEENTRPICKRATSLHTQICEQNYGKCTDSGHQTGDTIIYGSYGEKETLKSGDAFDCDVNGDGTYDPQTERFYYVSDYYNTSTKQFEDDTAVLIYYTNITKNSDGTVTPYTSGSEGDIEYNTNGDQTAGPTTIITNLPTTSEWKNVKLKNNLRDILAENNEGYVEYNNVISNLPKKFSYEGYAARLLTAQEVGKSCNITIKDGSPISIPTTCEYLHENTQYSIKNSYVTGGYYTETRSSASYPSAWGIEEYARIYDRDITYTFGTRPVIDVPKSKIETQTKDIYLSFSQQYINQIQSNITSSAQEGLYYFDNNGNLDYGNGTKIDVDKGVKPIPKGNINIYNKKVTYACFSFGGYNFEYDYTKNEVFERSMPCSTTRGSNLVYNGDLSLKDNTNLTQLGEYENGYIYNVTSDYIFRSIDDLIPIDTNKTYNISTDMKSSNTTSTYYVGFMEYDVDKNMIGDKYVVYIDGTLTTLSKDLKDGDTVVYLNNLDNWNVNTSTKTYQRGFIFWNYVDSTGYQYPELTYSRNVFSNLYEDSNVNKENNTITLNSPWSNGTIKSGTKLSQSNSSQSYNYRLMGNKPITTGWVNYNYSGLTGITNTAALNMDHFRAGSKYIRFTVGYNKNKTPDTTTYIRNININEVTN